MKQIVGRKPVLEALNAGEEIDRIFLLYGQRGGIIDAIRTAASKRDIRISELPAVKFNKISDHPNNQGVIAEISGQKYSSLDEIIAASKKKKYPLLLLLDSIQDTHNLGAIIRSAECSGVQGVIITKHNSAPVNSTVIKTSAGAAEHVRICMVNNLVNTIKELKKEGFWVVGTSLENSRDYTDVDYKMPVALVMGNEEKGIRKLTADNCDIIIKIPMAGKIQSLNVSVAAGVVLFEILRQRKVD